MRVGSRSAPRSSMSASPVACAVPAASPGDGRGPVVVFAGPRDQPPRAPGEHQLVADLIQVARHGTVAQLEVVVRGLRTVDHNEHATDPGEYVKQSWTSDSRWQLAARLDPERGAVVGAAIDAIAQRDGCTPAQALERLAQICLASLADAGNPPRDLRGDEHAAVVIHLDAARVPAHEVPARSAEPDPDDDSTEPRSAERDSGDPPIVARPYARVAGGPGLPDRVVQRLLCDGRIRTVIHDSTSNESIHRARCRTLPPPGHRPPIPRPAGPPPPPLRPPRLPQHQKPARPSPHPLDPRRPHRPGQPAAAMRTPPRGPSRRAVRNPTLGAGKFRFVSSDGRNLSARVETPQARTPRPWKTSTPTSPPTPPPPTGTDNDSTARMRSAS